MISSLLVLGAVPQSGGVYPKYRGENTGQNAPPPAMMASGKKSARPVLVPVQILLLPALKGRCSIRPPPVRRRSRRRRGTPDAMKCSINAIICTL
jgi:hypothetical protein